MIEQQMSERMYDAVLDEPPLGFDPDDVVTRATTRQRRRRRITATVGTTVAAVAAMAVVGTVASQPRGSDPVSVGGSSAAPVVDCPADPAAVLTPIVTDLLAEHVPAMQFLPPAATSYSCAGYVISQFAGPADTNERVEVQLFAGENAAERYTGLPDPVSDTTLPDGSRLFVYQIGGSPLTEVIHVRLDGQVAVADSTDVQKVSVEQLTAIVADPRLTF